MRIDDSPPIVSDDEETEYTVKLAEILRRVPEFADNRHVAYAHS